MYQNIVLEKKNTVLEKSELEHREETINPKDVRTFLKSSEILGRLWTVCSGGSSRDRERSQPGESTRGKDAQ